MCIVSAVTKVVLAFGGGELSQQLGEGLFQGVDSPCCCGSQQRFEFGEPLLDGVEVRAVRWQISQSGADRFNGLSHARHL